MIYILILYSFYGGYNLELKFNSEAVCEQVKERSIKLVASNVRGECIAVPANNLIQ